MIALDPPIVQAWARRGALRERGGDAAGAIEDFRHEIELTPRHWKARLRLGQALARTERIDEAKAELGRALELAHAKRKPEIERLLRALG